MIRLIARLVGFVMVVAGLCLFAWPFPLFTLNEPYLSWYIESVLMVDNKPGGAGAALPCLWMLTAPLGFAVAGIGVAVLGISTPNCP